MKAGDMKYSVRRGSFFLELPGYPKIKPKFQSSDSVSKGYEEIAICDFNIPVHVRPFLAVLRKHFLHTFSLIMESQTARDHMG